MNDFNKPIRPINKKDDDKIKTEAIIEKFKEERELTESKIKSSDKKTFIASYISMIKKFFNNLFYEKEAISRRAHDLYNAVQQIKIFLEQIRDENPTDDLKFAENLSNAWGNLLDNYHSSLTEPSSVDSNKVYQLIDAIDHYPPEEEHSLGFYLSRYSEEEWFPIPFFQLLNALHEECWNLKKSSHLDGWIALAEELLSEPNK